MTPIEAPEAGLNAAVAAELRAERAAQNLTVQQLSELADVPYASLRRYLAAERYIDVAVLHALATALKTSSTALIASAEERLSRVEPRSSRARSGKRQMRRLPSAT
jgi:transcriptional regulator with XRE-family HTH domain